MITKNTIPLSHSDQVKTPSDKYESEFTVGTVEGYLLEGETVEESLERAIEFKHDLAWVNMSCAVITADYEGKAEDLRKKSESYANAIVLEEGDHVILEGREYKVKILPNHERYSNGIQFVPFANHPYVSN